METQPNPQLRVEEEMQCSEDGQDLAELRANSRGDDYVIPSALILQASALTA